MATTRNSASVMYEAVLVKGCIVSVRIDGRDQPLVGEVVRTLCPISRTCALWPFGWSDVIVVPLSQLRSAVIADLTREELREIRTRQKGGQP